MASYRGEQSNLKRPVLIKIYNSRIRIALKARAREVSACSQINHPNAIRLLDTGVSRTSNQKNLFLIFEAVGGLSLSELMDAEGSLAPIRAWRIGAQLLSLLAAVHDAGLIYSSLNPEHLKLVDFPGSPDFLKVCSFGSTSAPDDLTDRERQSASTPIHYIAPELLQGEPSSIASDLYAVSVLLYWCLTGKMPFDGPNRALIRIRQAREEPVHLTEQLSISPQLAALIHQGLSKEPQQRPGSAREMLQALLSVPPEELLLSSAGAIDTIRSLPSASPTDIRLSSARLAEASASAKERLTAATVLSSAGACALGSLRPSVWIFTDDPAIERADVAAALSPLHDQLDVQSMSASQREELTEGLLSGEVTPPWVMIFGDMHILLEDSLLSLLRNYGETSRLLISTHLNGELLQSTVNFCGLDQSLSLPLSSTEIREATEQMVRRSERLIQHYDGLRMALKESQSQLQMSRPHHLEGAG